MLLLTLGDHDIRSTAPKIIDFPVQKRQHTPSCQPHEDLLPHELFQQSTKGSNGQSDSIHVLMRRKASGDLQEQQEPAHLES